MCCAQVNVTMGLCLKCNSFVRSFINLSSHIQYVDSRSACFGEIKMFICSALVISVHVTQVPTVIIMCCTFVISIRTVYSLFATSVFLYIVFFLLLLCCN